MSVYLALGVGKGRRAGRALEERKPCSSLQRIQTWSIPRDFQAPVCRELCNHTAAIAWESQSSWPRMNHHPSSIMRPTMCGLEGVSTRACWPLPARSHQGQKAGGLMASGGGVTSEIALVVPWHGPDCCHWVCTQLGQPHL